MLLFKQADIGEVIFGSVLAVGTLSTICLLPDAPAICTKARRTRTGPDGRYAFDIKGSDTQGTLGTESTLNVVFSGGPRRTSTTVSFSATGTDVELPDARLWNPRPRVRPPIRLTWSPLRGAGSGVTYSAQLYTADGASAIWSQPASGGAATLDPRILEDRPGTAAVGASATLDGGNGTRKVRASYLSERLSVGARAGAPPSRGRPCAAVTGTGPVRAGAFGRCGLTDGSLDAPAHLRAGATVTGAVIDLGRVRPVDLVVARGFAGQFLVELSSDGTTWSVVATNAGAAAAVPVPGGRSARYVRLRSPSGLDESLAHEISVW